MFVILNRSLILGLCAKIIDNSKEFGEGATLCFNERHAPNEVIAWGEPALVLRRVHCDRPKECDSLPRASIRGNFWKKQ